MIDQLSNAFEKLQNKLMSWLDTFVLHLPNLLISVLIVVVAWIAAKYVYNLVHRLILRAGGNRNVADLLGSIVRVVVIALGLFIALGILGLSQAVASLLAGAGIVGLAVGFALQDPLANLFSGVMMSVKELYSPGDLVETNGFMGKIEGITLRTTLIRTLQGQEVVIPNKDVLQSALVNYTVTKRRRIDLEVGISYGDDLERAASVIRESLHKELDAVGGEDDVEVFWTGFGDSSMNGVVRFWHDMTGQKDFLDARSRAIVAIKRGFDEADIMIPFPIRTLDFGIRGGEKLSEMRLNTGGDASES